MSVLVQFGWRVMQASERQLFHWDKQVGSAEARPSLGCMAGQTSSSGALQWAVGVVDSPPLSLLAAHPDLSASPLLLTMCWSPQPVAFARWHGQLLPADGDRSWLEQKVWAYHRESAGNQHQDADLCICWNRHQGANLCCCGSLLSDTKSKTVVCQGVSDPRHS